MAGCKEASPQGKGLRRRCHRLVINLNEEEYLAVQNYCRRYARGERAKAPLLRSLLLREMIKQYEEDSPLLFKEEEMRW